MANRLSLDLRRRLALHGEQDATLVLTRAADQGIAVAPGSICTETYFVAGNFDGREQTENFARFLTTKFVRFLILQRKTAQHIKPETFRFVPAVDFSRVWTDEDLYEEFALSEDQRAHIEATIRPRTLNLSLESSVPESHLPGGSKFKGAAAAAAASE